MVLKQAKMGLRGGSCRGGGLSPGWGFVWILRHLTGCPSLNYTRV